MTQSLLTAKASYALQIDSEPRVNKYQQSGNYFVNTEDGINTNLPEYSVEFTDLIDNIKQINTFLKEHRGSAAFRWKVTGTNSTHSFTCDEWGCVVNEAFSTLTAKFKQQPEYIEPEYLYYDGSFTYDGTYIYGVN